MGKAITEIDSYAGPMSGTTKLPVSDSDTLQAGTASQVLTYIVANLGDAATKNVGTTTGTVAAGDHTHTAYAGTGAIGSSGLTMATAKLLGRSTAGTGAPEEITLGTNLSFSGTTLNAAGGGGSPGGSDTQVQVNNAGAF